jgi:hypothetical protein
MANDRLNPGPREKGRQTRKRPARTKEDKAVAEPVKGVAAAGENEQKPEKEEPQAMAEEQKNTPSSEGIRSAGEKEAPVTEKPVATRRKILQYVVSVDDATGCIVKMEKQDEKTGERKEFTQQEYAAAYAFGSYAAPYYAAYAASLYDPVSSPAVQAYLKSISDYIKACTVKR